MKLRPEFILTGTGFLTPAKQNVKRENREFSDKVV